MESTEVRKRGRPKGSKTQEKPVVKAATPRCPACKSTERTRFTNTVTHEYAGIDTQGHPCTHVVWRTCVCEGCGQAWRLKTWENRTKADEKIAT